MPANWGNGRYGKYYPQYRKGLEKEENSCFNPQVNANNAARILNENLALKGDVWGMARAYNGGPKSISRAAKEYANDILKKIRKHESCYV